jgi:hypothetical protein
VKQHIDVLKVLKNKPKLRKAIVSASSKELILALCEIIANVLSGNVKLSPSEKQKIQKYNSVLRKLVDKSTKVRAKKQLILQKGGFLPVILGPALTILASVLGSLI